MANTSVFTGADGSITLSASTGPEGEKAQAALTEFELISVGRAQNVRVEVRSELHVFNELGQRYATEIRPGNVTIRGTVGRAYLNGALINLLLGDAAKNRPATSFAQPSFNITLLLENAATPGVRNTVTLHDVKIENWVLDIPEDDFVTEQMDFQALYLSVVDETA